MYEGTLVRLREHRMEEAEILCRWMNDLDTSRKLRGGGMRPFTLDAEQDWIRSNAGVKPNENHFAVETLEGGVLIGGCSYHQVDWRNRRCMVGWYIGDAQMRGKGYGTDMIRTLLNICFTELNMRKVSLNVFEHNPEAIRLYEKLGFVREGVFRKELFTQDRWWDEYRYGMFREEWDATQRT